MDHLTEGLEEFVPAGERHLLVVLPHPDDESFAAGGTMARCSDANVPVTFLCGTYGDMGRRMGSPFFATREAMRDVRQQELRDACAVLGAEARWLGLRDRTVEFEDPHEVAARISVHLEELLPSTVITFFPGHAVHPDHDSLGHAAHLAVQRFAGPRPKLLAVAVGDRDRIRAELGPPHVYCDVRSVVERKLGALKAHRSQTEMMFQRWERGDEEDDQTRTFREEMLVLERFYRLPLD
ncbi:MAG: bacillithiol biosynthesis deacetylase BshB2 [Trueperaceae bacterium]|nr:bacillithiol biosynthesis deacetylase BshB2 [Trueperaceae bacterium]